MFVRKCFHEFRVRQEKVSQRLVFLEIVAMKICTSLKVAFQKATILLAKDCHSQNILGTTWVRAEITQAVPEAEKPQQIAFLGVTVVKVAVQWRHLLPSATTPEIKLLWNTIFPGPTVKKAEASDQLNFTEPPVKPAEVLQRPAFLEAAVKKTNNSWKGNILDTTAMEVRIIHTLMFLEPTVVWLKTFQNQASLAVIVAEVERSQWTICMQATVVGMRACQRAAMMETIATGMKMPHLLTFVEVTVLPVKAFGKVLKVEALWKNTFSQPTVGCRHPQAPSA